MTRADGSDRRHGAKGRLLLGLVVMLAGCVSRPKFIDGHRVIGTRWVNGKIVYVLGDSAADREQMQESAKEADGAAKNVVFKPTP